MPCCSAMVFAHAEFLLLTWISGLCFSGFLLSPANIGSFSTQFCYCLFSFFSRLLQSLDFQFSEVALIGAYTLMDLVVNSQLFSSLPASRGGNQRGGGAKGD